MSAQRSALTSLRRIPAITGRRRPAAAIGRAAAQAGQHALGGRGGRIRIAAQRLHRSAPQVQDRSHRSSA